MYIYKLSKLYAQDLQIQLNTNFQNTTYRNPCYVLNELDTRLKFSVRLPTHNNNSNVIISLFSDKSFEKEKHKEHFDSQYIKIQLYFLIYFPEFKIIKYGEPYMCQVLDVTSKWNDLINYLDSELNEQENLLLIALKDLRRVGGIFDGFPKLVTWLDDNKATGISGFCAIRDGLSHGKLDRAYKSINEQFPDAFDFDENSVLKRNTHNANQLRTYVLQLQHMIDEVFKQKFIDSPK